MSKTTDYDAGRRFVLQIRLTAFEHKNIKETAERLRLPMSEFVRMVVQAYIKENPEVH